MLWFFQEDNMSLQMHFFYISFKHELNNKTSNATTTTITINNYNNNNNNNSNSNSNSNSNDNYTLKI